MSLELTAEIRGQGFRPPAKAIIEGLKPQAKLILVREPTNEYDRNAVQVWVKPQAVEAEQRPDLELKLAGYGLTLEEFDAPPEWFLGYVGKEHAKDVSPALAQPGAQYRAEIGFNGAGKPTVKISIS